MTDRKCEAEVLRRRSKLVRTTLENDTKSLPVDGEKRYVMLQIIREDQESTAGSEKNALEFLG